MLCLRITFTLMPFQTLLHKCNDTVFGSLHAFGQCYDNGSSFIIKQQLTMGYNFFCFNGHVTKFLLLFLMKTLNWWSFEKQVETKFFSNVISLLTACHKPCLDTWNWSLHYVCFCTSLFIFNEIDFLNRVNWSMHRNQKKQHKWFAKEHLSR